MSKVFNMVGGGGGISENRAVLVARVPDGSTVTATKGGITLTPKMWVVEADPTQDIALFVIAPSLFDSVNPWTVTATLGTDTASDTVIVDDNKEYEVELSYTLYLFDAGAVSPYVFTRGAGTITISTTIHVKAGSGNTAWCTASPAVDLTDLTLLSMNVSAIGVDKDGRSKLYISNSVSSTMVSSVGATGTGEFSIDVSGFSGAYYVGLYTQNNAEFTVDKIWAE